MQVTRVKCQLNFAWETFHSKFVKNAEKYWIVTFEDKLLPVIGDRRIDMLSPRVRWHRRSFDRVNKYAGHCERVRKKVQRVKLQTRDKRNKYFSSNLDCQKDRTKNRFFFLHIILYFLTLYWCVSMPMRTLKKSAVNRASCSAVAPDSNNITGTSEKNTNCVMQ